MILNDDLGMNMVTGIVLTGEIRISPVLTEMHKVCLCERSLALCLVAGGRAPKVCIVLKKVVKTVGPMLVKW